MNKFYTSFFHTYFSKLKSPSFIIATLIVVFFIFVVANVDRIINIFQDDSEIVVEVDASEEFFADFMELHTEEDDRFTFTNEVSESLQENVVLIEVESEYPVVATMRALEDIPNNLNTNIRFTLNELNRAQALEEVDITAEEVEILNSPATIEYDVVDQEVSVSETGEILSIGRDISPLNLIVFNIGLFVMFFTVINYASQIGTEIAMEKSSRVIEIIVSSMPPVKHLVAKILAMFLIAVTQLLIWVIVGIAAFMSFDLDTTLVEFGIEANEHTLIIIIFTLIYIVLGMFLYLAIAAILGSFISRIEDLQQGIMPVTMLTIAGFYIGIFNAVTGENMLTTITSYIPFFTPFVMPLRIMHDPDNIMVQLIGITIMIVTIIITLLLAARVYRGSVLSTEKGIVKNFKRVFTKKTA